MNLSKKEVSKKSSLKTKIVSGMIWKFGERIVAQGVSFIVSMVLARLLMPEDYGTVSVVLLVINVANVFINNGLSVALIQKKEVSQRAFSTVFYCNLLLGVFVYFILYAAAPLIANIYKTPELVSILRILALILPISSVQSVQNAYVSKNMLFQKFFFSTIGGTIFSGIIGIGMAMAGFGAWALVAQYMVNVIVNTLIMFIVIDWRPSAEFSFPDIVPLIKYGWNVLCTDLIGTFSNQFNDFLIGAKCSTVDLAFYSKGKQLPHMVSTNIYTTILSVLFPAMSIVNNNPEEVKKMSRKSIQLLSFVMFPVMVGLIVVAKSVIILLFTEKWLESVPFLRIICLEGMVSVIGTISLQSLKAMGRSDIMLKLEFIKKPIYFIGVLFLMRYGVFALALALPINALIELIINAFPTNKIIHYHLGEQLLDCFPSLLLSCTMGILVFCVSLFEWNLYITLGVQIIVGVVSYFLLGYITKNTSMMYLLDMVKAKLRRK